MLLLNKNLVKLSKRKTYYHVYSIKVGLIDTFSFQERFAQNSILEEIQYSETLMQNVNKVHLCISQVLHSDVSTHSFYSVLCYSEIENRKK